MAYNKSDHVYAFLRSLSVNFCKLYTVELNCLNINIY